MIRRIKFSGRKKIDKKDIEISFESGIIKNLNFNYSNYGFSENCDVWFEIYRKSEFERFYAGKIKNITLSNKETDILSEDYDCLFNLKVVDGNKIKGLCKQIRLYPKGKENNSILPVKFDDSENLKERIWKIIYDDAGPVLYIRKEYKSKLSQKDPELFFLIYPSALKEILIKLLLVDKISKEEDAMEEWQKSWIKFAIDLAKGEDLSEPNEETIDVLTDKFCSNNRQIFEKIDFEE
ncbi:MAG: hypothetical protein AB1637_08635 [Elusimicrobiota bacterium]